ncbi:hypothetical protein, partial [Sphingomonas sp. NFR04]|uniref:hypothetical protein n=1 Tax=Sphingomonas sp. NFR04 TaxID=1566283 RepID=UPI001C3159A6
RRPHVPSSKPTMSKSDKNRRCAFPLFPGRPLRLNFGDRRCLSEEHRVGEVASMREVPTRQHRFAFLWRRSIVLPGNPQKTAISWRHNLRLA